MTMDDGCHVKGRSRLSLIEGSAIFKADWQLRFENFKAELSGADEQRYNVTGTTRSGVRLQCHDV